MRYLLLLISILKFACVQAQYTMQGKIEYERKMNIYRRVDDMEEDDKIWAEKMKAQTPKFTISYFDLYFVANKTFYKPGRETDLTVKNWLGTFPANENIVYADYSKDSITAQKQVYEEKFLVHDSVRKLQWKIMDEIRTIADFKCRKAVARICDSVYVVAFYTDDIITPGGPEMFSGLPGMILEIAIPRLYATWTATKIEVTTPKDGDIIIPTKGKKLTQKGLYDTVEPNVQRFGKKYAHKNIWWVTL